MSSLTSDGSTSSIWLLTWRSSSAPDRLIWKLLNHGRDLLASKSVAPASAASKASPTLRCDAHSDQPDRHAPDRPGARGRDGADAGRVRLRLERGSVPAGDSAERGGLRRSPLPPRALGAGLHAHRPVRQAGVARRIPRPGGGARVPLL